MEGQAGNVRIMKVVAGRRVWPAAPGCSEGWVEAGPRLGASTRRHCVRGRTATQGTNQLVQVSGSQTDASVVSAQAAGMNAAPAQGPLGPGSWCARHAVCFALHVCDCAYAAAGPLAQPALLVQSVVVNSGLASTDRSCSVSSRRCRSCARVEMRATRCVCLGLLNRRRRACSAASIFQR